MENNQITIFCPHCNRELNAEASLIGTNVSCPFCSKFFMVHTTQLSATENQNKNSTPPKSHKGKYNYPWGRAYISAARILAVFTLIGVFVAALFIISIPFEVRNFESRDLANNEIPALLKKQDLFIKNYQTTSSLVLSGNRSKAKFNFPEDLNTVTHFFNQRLNSVTDVDESLKTLQIYESKIEIISRTMSEFFRTHCNAIMKKLSDSEDSRKNSTNFSHPRLMDSSLHLSWGESYYFYAKNSAEKDIYELARYLAELEQQKSCQKLGYKQEIRALSDGLNFIVDTFYSHKKNFILRGKTFFDEDHRSEKKKNTESMQFQKEKNSLAAAIELLDKLTIPYSGTGHPWTITNNVEMLRKDLLNHKSDIQKIQNDFNKQIKLAIIHTVPIILLGLFAAFLLLVFADYLSAHFDTASILSDIKCKMNLVLLPLIGLFILAGCQESTPAEKLQENKAELCAEAINNCFNEQIDKNPSASVYGIPGKQLILISDGEKNGIISNNAFGISLFHPRYNGFIISCSANATFSKIQSINTIEYSHKSFMTLNLRTEIQKTNTDNNQYGTPGISIATINPEQFTSNSFDKSKWHRQCLAYIPEAVPHHSFVIRQLKRNKKIIDSRKMIFPIVFDSISNKWKLEGSGKLFNPSAPPDYIESQVAQQMQVAGFKKITIPYNGSPHSFWMRKQDYQIADNLFNKQMVKHNGKWKKKHLVESSFKLQADINEFLSHKHFTLQQLKHFIEGIKNNPDAENRNDAILILDRVLTESYLKKHNSATAENQEVLLHILNIIKKDSLLPQEKRHSLAKIYQSQIRDIEKRMAAEKLAKIKRRNEIKKSSAKINIAIKKFKKNLRWRKLESELRNHIHIIKYDAGYHCALKDLLTIGTMRNKLKNSTASYFDKNFKFKDYSLSDMCHICNGQGTKSCYKCNGTGLCNICNGSGVQKVTAAILKDGKFATYQKTVSCKKYCNNCNGVAIICVKCNGNGVLVNKNAIKEVFCRELDSFSKLVKEKAEENIN